MENTASHLYKEQYLSTIKRLQTKQCFCIN